MRRFLRRSLLQSHKTTCAKANFIANAQQKMAVTLVLSKRSHRQINDNPMIRRPYQCAEFSLASHNTLAHSCKVLNVTQFLPAVNTYDMEEYTAVTLVLSKPSRSKVGDNSPPIRLCHYSEFCFLFIVR